MNRVQSNSRGRRESPVPQRPFVPHPGQNYSNQFIPEPPITFPSRAGRDGIALTDIINENSSGGGFHSMVAGKETSLIWFDI